MTEQVERERVGVIVVHGVGNCEPGWINHSIIERLKARCRSLCPRAYCESYQLEDRGRSEPGSYFPAFVRRATMGRRRSVAFIELYWADLSKVGDGPFYMLLAALRLFYEAPFILAHSFMGKRRSGYFGILKRLILFATWMLRWPIAGMNTTALVCSLAVIALDSLEWLRVAPLAVMLCGILLVLAVVCYFIARQSIHRDLWLTDVAFATSLFSVLAIDCIIALNLLLPLSHLETPAAYLALALPPILYIWVLWSATIAAAILMLVPVYLMEALGWRPKNDLPLARPGAALGLVLLQGLIWKVIVAPLSVSVIEKIATIKPVIVQSSFQRLLAVRTDGVSGCLLGDGQALIMQVCRIIERAPAEVLTDAVSRLKGVFVYNSLHAIYTIAIFVAIILVRVFIVRLPRLTTAVKARLMPRVIMSQSIIAFLFCGSVFNLYIYWAQLYEYEFFLHNLPLIRAVWLWPAVFAIVVAVLYFFNIFQVVTASIVHIFRDVVDHQYRPRFDNLEFAMPGKARPKSPWPRRARIQERMNVLLQTIVRDHQFDRIVLAGHSQGSVIIYEYLKSDDDNADLGRVQSIDIVSVGSPLTHLYQYYFDEYGGAPVPARDLNPVLRSWTNLCRFDDPIGGPVSILADGFIRNVGLDRGGHMDYWSDPQVCDAILDAISPDWRDEDTVSRVLLFPGFAPLSEAAPSGDEAALRDA